MWPLRIGRGKFDAECISTHQQALKSPPPSVQEGLKGSPTLGMQHEQGQESGERLRATVTLIQIFQIGVRVLKCVFVLRMTVCKTTPRADGLK